MFEKLIKYLNSRDLTYVRNNNIIDIEWNHCESCKYIQKGWMIETSPETDKYRGVERIKIGFRFAEIKDTEKLERCWDSVKKERAWWKYPDAYSSFYSDGECRRVEDVLIIEKEILLNDNSFLALAKDLDMEFMHMAKDIISAIAKYEPGDCVDRLEKSDSQFSREGFYDFAECHLPSVWSEILPF